MPTFNKRTAIPVPVTALAAWHESPAAFERLLPPWEKVNVLSREGDCYNGKLSLTIGRGPFAMHWDAAHGPECAKGEYFVDRQVRGPFRSWVHTHRFLTGAAGAGAGGQGDQAHCTLEDEISWEAPLGPIGAAVGRVESRLERGFAFRHARTAEDLTRHSDVAALDCSQPRLARPLRVLISGASGLVGAELIAFLRVGGHEVIRLVRRSPGPGEARWDPAKGEIDLSRVGAIDAVVHLSGESVSTRWTDKAKAEIIASRETSTLLLARAIAALEPRPRVFVSASAVGWYGSRGDEPLTEESQPGASGFLPEVCRRWEEATRPATDAGIRTVNLRIGVVMSARGGALAGLMTPVLWGVGGVVGDGQQMFPWIAMDDLVHLVHWAIYSDVAGPLNATAPRPVTNRELMHTLGRVLHRPVVLPLPAPIVQLLFGEMGREVLLEGQNALPAKALAAGFRFSFPELEPAVRWQLGR